MLTLLDDPHTVYSPSTKAYEVAGTLQKDDPDWSYIVKENPTPNGRDTAIISVYDEEGYFMGYFGK